MTKGSDASMPSRFSRAGLLRRGLVGGGSLVAVGSASSAFAASASALGPAGGDLASLRLLIGAELLALDFQARALASGKLQASRHALIVRIHADEQAHYDGLASLMNGAGQTPATADDIDFAYPGGTFGSQASILELSGKLEELQLGAYVGVSQTMSAPRLRLAVAQITANEAQHVAALATASGRPAIGRAFGPALSSSAVTSVLDDYES